MTLQSPLGEPANLGPEDLRHHLLQLLLPLLSLHHQQLQFIKVPPLRAFLVYAAEPTSGPTPDHAKLVECGPPAAGYER